jgi:hypothetical protein
MKFILIFIIFLSSAASAGTYFGLNYGYTGYTSDALEKYKVGPKGATYGGFFGFGKDALGLEFIYQSLSAKGQIKHDGEKHAINENATAMGGAVRLSFSSFYVRGGLASYQLNQSVDISNAASRATAEDVYDIRKKGARQNGSLYGGGVHTKWGSTTLFVDFTRYQVGNVGHYDAVAVGLSFPISEKFFSLK